MFPKKSCTQLQNDVDQLLVIQIRISKASKLLRHPVPNIGNAAFSAKYRSARKTCNIQLWLLNLNTTLVTMAKQILAAQIWAPIMYDHVFQTSYCVLVSGDELNNDKAPIYNVQWWNVIIIILCNLVINYLIKFIFHVEGCKGWKRLID